MSGTDKFRRYIKEYKEQNGFARLKEIASRLTPQEKECVPPILDAFKKGSKLSALWEYILNNPKSDRERCAEALQIHNLNTLDKQVERLIDKVKEIMILEINTDRKGAYSDVTQMEMATYRGLMKIHLLLGKKNLPGEANIEIEDSISIATEAEDYNNLVTLLKLKRRFLRHRVGSKDYIELSSKISFYETCRDAVETAKDIYMQYTQYAAYDGYRRGFAEEFSDDLAILKDLKDKTASDTVAYYFYIIKVGCLQEAGHYAQAATQAKEMLSLVSGSRLLDRPKNISEAHRQISDSLICNRQFDEAMSHSKKAIEASNIAFNQSLAEELEYWALFYSGRHLLALQKIESILSNGEYRQSPYFDNKYRYFHACSLFAIGKEEESFRVLNTVKEISSDREGWNIGIRVLNLILSFSEGDTEERAHYFLEAYRVHLYELKSKGAIRGRDQAIYKICNDLFRTSGNFKKVYNKRHEEFKLLESPDPEYGWQIKSHELIIFHEWFKAMMKGEKYNLDLSAQAAPQLAAV